MEDLNVSSRGWVGRILSPDMGSSLEYITYKLADRQQWMVFNIRAGGGVNNP
jgi:hypothetical protein